MVITEPDSTQPDRGDGREPEDAAPSPEPGARAAADADAAPGPDGGADAAPGPDAKPDDHERWQRFASGATPSPAAAPPGRLRAAGGLAARAARSEWTLAGLFSALLAVGMTWPLAKDLDDVIPHDTGDPLLLTYILGWVGHALRGDPGGIWDTNSFWPLTDAYLFTDTLLGYAPFALFATGPTSALVVYNVLYIASFALAFLGAYALLRQLGARVAGSAVAAAAFAYAPWKLGQAGHLQVLSCGGIALALAMLARGHGWSLRHGFKPERQRPGWIVAGWLTALWQFSIGAGLGIPFVYLLLGTGVVVGLHWLVLRPRLKWQTIAANGVGGVVFSLGVLWIADRHAVVAREYPEAVRDVDYISWFSPTWQSFIISPEESRLWGAAHEAARADLTWAPEQALLVGFTLAALAVVGLVWSCWTGWQRLWLALGGALVFAIAMGPNFLDHGSWAWLPLYEYAPGWDAIRTPGRLVIYLTLILAVLAAGTLTRFADEADDVAHRARVDKRLKVKAPRRVQALLFLPLVPVLWEGLTVAPYVEVPEAPVDMAALEGPVLFLPSGGGDTKVQYWSTDGFVEVANGVAAFTPDEQAGLRSMAETFPADDAVEALREAGIETVVVLPGSGLDLGIEPFGVEVQRVGDSSVYDLNP
ncbi:hypothetical protein SAMN05216298_4805 [Glycomyces sambucus]|uniref:4-amino-4-deoxy-L-arabinose transferase n=1 Tax=Glycomyces sambucus TaxID=380244 RepID=A0A1G9M432_9ACTN|nr:hypothetical protein [Glycomyces sambucus]SDL68711.1 hypothetical protein SAMN05216298_4805 [Glycomyces sambucus]